ncbi:hypothetical protein HNQ39_000512 [Armatimonas rosea]|uniref:Uncharacterized protein n=1 Tax=Armatimonas rosea TaxID=685828 RepID=A0A7W9W5B5_ARMRO|nr:hypothetical protein [Armatimonas rosea]
MDAKYLGGLVSLLALALPLLAQPDKEVMLLRLGVSRR